MIFQVDIVISHHKKRNKFGDTYHRFLLVSQAFAKAQKFCGLISFSRSIGTCHISCVRQSRWVLSLALER